jgi:hypothetical protein
MSGTADLVAAQLFEQRPGEHDRLGVGSGFGQLLQHLWTANAEAAGKCRRAAAGGRRQQKEPQAAVDREHPVAILERDQAVDQVPIEEEAAEGCGSPIGGETRRQEHAETAAAAQQGERAFQEQLIEVDVAVALRGVDAGPASEVGQLRRRRPRGIPRLDVPAVAAQHLPGWVADDRVESGRRTRIAAGVVEDFRKLERPVKEALARRDRPRGRDERRRHVIRQAAAAEYLVGDRTERHWHATATGLEPRATPRVADLFPAFDRRAIVVQRREGALLGAHLFERVARFGGDARPDGDRVAQHDVVVVFAKER